MVEKAKVQTRHKYYRQQGRRTKKQLAFRFLIKRKKKKKDVYTHFPLLLPLRVYIPSSSFIYFLGQEMRTKEKKNEWITGQGHKWMRNDNDGDEYLKQNGFTQQKTDGGQKDDRQKKRKKWRREREKEIKGRYKNHKWVNRLANTRDTQTGSRASSTKEAKVFFVFFVRSFAHRTCECGWRVMIPLALSTVGRDVTTKRTSSPKAAATCCCCTIAAAAATATTAADVSNV